MLRLNPNLQVMLHHVDDAALLRVPRILGIMSKLSSRSISKAGTSRAGAFGEEFDERYNKAVTELRGWITDERLILADQARLIGSLPAHIGLGVADSQRRDQPASGRHVSKPGDHGGRREGFVLSGKYSDLRGRPYGGFCDPGRAWIHEANTQDREAMLYLPCCQFHNQLPRRPRKNQGHAAPLRTEKRIWARAGSGCRALNSRLWLTAGNPDAGCREKYPMNSTDIQASPYGLARCRTLGSIKSAAIAMFVVLMDNQTLRWACLAQQ